MIELAEWGSGKGFGKKFGFQGRRIIGMMEGSFRENGVVYYSAICPEN
ncbi:MAG: hypothetical protein ACXVMS_10520 [Flavisolibacter sp.]